MTQYYSKVMIQKPGKDTVDKLEGAMCEAINKFHEKSGSKHFPEQIIVYRDGVGEGQLRRIKHFLV